MKQILSLFLFSLLSGCLCAAEAGGSAPTASAAEPPVYKSWAPFQLGLFPGVPSYVHNSRVIGLKTGWPISSGTGSTVDGFESSWIYSGTQYVNGLQASLFMNISRDLKGFEPAIAMNLNGNSLIGIQASCVMNVAGDVTGVQAGGLNIARRVDGFQPGVLGCITREMNGFQTGLFTVAKVLDGVQFSGVNVCGEAGDCCFQMGLVNVATKGRGVQFGLINVIKDGTVPFLPFFNISL